MFIFGPKTVVLTIFDDFFWLIGQKIDQNCRAIAQKRPPPWRGGVPPPWGGQKRQFWSKKNKIVPLGVILTPIRGNSPEMTPPIGGSKEGFWSIFRFFPGTPRGKWKNGQILVENPISNLPKLPEVLEKPPPWGGTPPLGGVYRRFPGLTKRKNTYVIKNVHPCSIAHVNICYYLFLRNAMGV